MLIIGGTGDLSRRHLLPALTRLLDSGELAADFSVVVAGLEPLSVESCRALLGDELSAHASDLPAAAREALLGRISYLQADVRDTATFEGLDATEPLLAYVATPPDAVPAALRALGHAAAPLTRIVLDKPFGLGREPARALNAYIRDTFEPQQVFRIDHFLYHHVVQELLRWRVHPDPLCLVDLLPVGRVEIVWDETRVAQPDGRSYPGAMRDMVQSHLLQLLAVVTMDSPESMTRADLAESRLAALRAVSVGEDEGSSPTRARHGGDASTAASSTAPSEPETLVTLELRSRLPRWQGVHFFLRAAKGVAQSRRCIQLWFAHRPRGASLGYVRLDVLAADLVIGREDDSSVEFALPADQESPSTRLLRDALAGDDTFTLAPEEPEESWRIVEPILERWDESEAPMTTYPVGASVAEIARSGTELRGT
jgi:glucose-6-phosphate 1-dehydrogenase